MASWTGAQTNAQKDLKEALKVVDSVIGYMSSTQGAPSRQERALFAAAIVLAYGVWENYVEQVAIELKRNLSNSIRPDLVPDRARQFIEKGSSPWQLAGPPGWRALWIAKVEEMAVGTDSDKFGLNSAKAGQVTNLLELAGVAGAFAAAPGSVVPEHLADSSEEVAAALNRLVELRGEIVHTGAVPSSLRKQHVREWREFGEKLAEQLDKECRKQCKGHLQ